MTSWGGHHTTNADVSQITAQLDLGRFSVRVNLNAAPPFDPALVRTRPRTDLPQSHIPHAAPTGLGLPGSRSVDRSSR